MKKLLMPLLLLVVSVCFSQKVIKTNTASEYSIHVFGDDFEGVIFEKEYKQPSPDALKVKYFTPNNDEIESTEIIMRKNLISIEDTSKQNIAINDNLKTYLRQYFDYIDKNGDKIIFINCLKKSSIPYGNRSSWLKNMDIPWDGGIKFWRVKLNLTTKRLFDFWVNG